MLQRLSHSIKYENDQFVNTSRTVVPNAGRQYYHAYNVRLDQCRSRLIAAAKSKWGESVQICRISEVEEGLKCVVYGTLYKEQFLKPSILRELADEMNETTQAVNRKLISDNDSFLLEEAEQKISLTGVVISNSNNLVTGIPIALCGTENEDGKFIVDEFVFLSCQMQIDRIIYDQDCYVLFLSGVNFSNGEKGSDGRRSELFCWLLLQWLSGLIGSDDDINLASKVCRVIFAGNMINSSTLDKRFNVKAKYLMRNVASSSVGVIDRIEEYFCAMSNILPVTVMPGSNDMSNYMMPQQAIHKALFPKLSRQNNFDLVTNPCMMSFDDLKLDFIGTSGQNVDDLYRFSDTESRCDILENVLRWGHLCPTAPDTLGTYPAGEEDAFFITRRPHILFAGNQPEFESKIINSETGQQTLLLSIPAFDCSKTAVLVNLKDFSVIPMHFNQFIN